MKHIKILDCTLRDGGYINNFQFGENVMRRIIQKLSSASIDIIECGFLKADAVDKECSLFNSVEAIEQIIGKKNKDSMYVAMIQYGEISIEDISECDDNGIDGIRLTFHEHEIDGAFKDGRKLMQKGYKVFMQPVGTTTYSDRHLVDLIDKVNKLRPYAFYIVDTLGTMYKKDLLRLYYLVDHNLDDRIAVGFHSHNNLQMSFANAQELIQMNTPRQLIIDASVYGMGRGAGNLCTELIAQYINDNVILRYNNLEILEILDSCIRPLKKQYEWGYDSAYYIASVNGCHPNYAQYLLNLQTLRIQDINAILSGMDIEERTLYNRQYIEDEYVKYMDHHINDEEIVLKYQNIIKNKKILLLAPGKSILYNKQSVDELISTQDFYVISINFLPDFTKYPNCVFISNLKRYEGQGNFYERIPKNVNIIITSNICKESSDKFDVIDYEAYLSEEHCIIDNAGLMCINFLRKLGVKNVLLAGFDGFSPKMQENYYNHSMYMDVESERLQQMNQAFARKLVQLRTQMDIKFFTPTIYEE